MGGETLQAFNFARNVYVKEKRRGAEPQESDPSFLPFFFFFLSTAQQLPPTRPNPSQPRFK